MTWYMWLKVKEEIKSCLILLSNYIKLNAMLTATLKIIKAYTVMHSIFTISIENVIKIKLSIET